MRCLTGRSLSALVLQWPLIRVRGCSVLALVWTRPEHPAWWSSGHCRVPGGLLNQHAAVCYILATSRLCRLEHADVIMNYH